MMENESLITEIVEEKQELTLIPELTESRLIKSDNNFKQYTSQDFTDIIFLYFISLKILKSEREFSHAAVKYAMATAMYNHFEQKHFQSTDLYVLLRQLFVGNDEIFKNQKASEVHMDKIDPYFRVTQHERDIIKWLKNLHRNDYSTDRRFLLKMEIALGVKNSGYKSVRRLASEWEELELSNKKLCLTRLLMALRYKARRSELLPYLEKLAKEEKLEIKNGVTNPETGEENTSSMGNFAKGAAALGGAYLGYKLLKGVFGGKKKKQDESVDVELIDRSEQPVVETIVEVEDDDLNIENLESKYASIGGNNVN